MNETHQKTTMTPLKFREILTLQKRRRRFASLSPTDSANLFWHAGCSNPNARAERQRPNKVRIESDSRDGVTRIRLIGRFQSEHVKDLEKLLHEQKSVVVLDLKEVTLVDVDVVRFLAACHARGVKIVHCARYVREWMARERQG